MAKYEHAAKLQDGVKSWNRWRRENTDILADLRQADLSEADLSGADLTEADLSGADLTEADLPGADLRQADLRQADLRQADLSEADLRQADLRQADLTGADLTGADLPGADLSEANLTGADLTWTNLTGVKLSRAKLTAAKFAETIFANTDLRDIKELDTCMHLGPSTIDHRTLAQSGPLPLAFLRGCGVPDRLIEYLPALFNEVIQFYSCFISYSTQDQEFADRLHADLQSKGVRCWFAPHQIAAGKKLDEQIDEAIRLYERLLLILSPASMKSEWVKTEIAKARRREVKEQRRVLFPIRVIDFESLREWECFDADTGKDSAREIREYFIPDSPGGRITTRITRGSSGCCGI